MLKSKRIFIHNYYLFKNIRKLEGSLFYAKCNLTIENKLQNRLRFDGLSQKNLHQLNLFYEFLKFDFFVDPYFIFLYQVENLNLPIFLHKKISKRAYVPLDKMYQLRIGYRIRTIYRAVKVISYVIQHYNKVFVLWKKLYLEFSLLFLNTVSDSFGILEKNLNAMFVNKRSLYILYL